MILQVWEGAGVVKSARKLIGATNPLEAEPGTIRGDLAVQTGRNIVHGSDSPENGEREAGVQQHFIYFPLLNTSCIVQPKWCHCSWMEMSEFSGLALQHHKQLMSLV